MNAKIRSPPFCKDTLENTRDIGGLVYELFRTGTKKIFLKGSCIR